MPLSNELPDRGQSALPARARAKRVSAEDMVFADTFTEESVSMTLTIKLSDNASGESRFGGSFR